MIQHIAHCNTSHCTLQLKPLHVEIQTSASHSKQLPATIPALAHCPTMHLAIQAVSTSYCTQHYTHCTMIFALCKSNLVPTMSLLHPVVPAIVHYNTSHSLLPLHNAIQTIVHWKTSPSSPQYKPLFSIIQALTAMYAIPHCNVNHCS